MTLSSIQTVKKHITIAAFDHRGSLSSLFGIDAHSQEGTTQLSWFKSLCMELFSPICSGFLVDQEFGESAIAKKDPHAGLLLTLEKTSYERKNPEELPQTYAEDGVEQIASRGAAVKFFFDYHPLSQNAQAKRAIVASLYERTKKAGSIFLIEPIVHPLAGQSREAFRAEFMQQHLQLVSEFTGMCDVLKLQFPLLPEEEFVEDIAAERCASVSERATVPWILLSRETPFDRYIRGVSIAMQQGASGFAVGRAAWQDVSKYQTQQEREQFMRTIAVDRMKQLIDVVES